MPDSTLAGIITASAGCLTAVALIITAWAGLIRSRRVEAKVVEGNEEIAKVHVIVNHQRTEMQTVIVQQQQQLLALEARMERAGLTIPVTGATTGEPIVATAVIVREGED